MSRLLGPPDKFLPSEWKHANQVHFRSSEAERAQSERLAAECQRLIEESNKYTNRMQQDAQKRLGMQNACDRMKRRSMALHEMCSNTGCVMMTLNLLKIRGRNDEKRKLFQIGLLISLIKTCSL